MPRRLAFFVLALSGFALTMSPITGQPVTTPDAMRLARISPWIDATHPFSAVLQITNQSELALENVSVSATLHGRVFNRSQLRLALEGRPQTAAIGSFSLGVEPLQPGEGRRVSLERNAQDLGGVSSTGVYPLTITLTHPAGRQQIFTALPYLAAAPTQQLNVSWIVSVSRPTITPPDGVYASDAVSSLNLEGFAQQLGAIAGRPTVPITMVVNPSLLDTLVDLSDGYASATPTGVEQVEASEPTAQTAGRVLSSMRLIASGRAELASVPYAPADLPALVRRGAPGDLARQIATGRATLEQHLGRAPSPGILVPPGLAIDLPTVRALREIGISGVAIDPALLAVAPAEPFQPELFGPSRPVALADTGVRAALPDLPMRATLNGTERGALLGQALIAETASAWLELPVFAPDRVLFLAGDSLPSPPALATALDGLTAAPWVRARHASEALGALAPQGPPAQLLPVRRADTAFLTAARAARRDLSTLEAITVDRFPDLDVLDRRVLLASSAEWATDPGAGTRLASAARAAARAVTGSISVAERRVTLTARTGSIPVTITTGETAPAVPLRVRVRVVSAKLTFPAGDAQTIDLDSRTATLDFPVSARTAGTFPLDVVVETPDGSTMLTTGRLILRSSAVSAVTLAAVGGSTAFLLVAYVRRARKREGRARALAAHPAGSTRTPTEPGP